MSYQQYRPTGFRLLPEVVKNLIIINGLFFLATYVLDSTYAVNLVDKLGLHYYASEKFHPYQLITYMFMHGGLSHIFLNMFALWMFGNALENYWGPKRFLTYYIITGIGAALIHYVVYYFEIKPTLSFLNEYLTHPNIDTFNTFLKSKFFHIDSTEMEVHYNALVGKFNALQVSGDTHQMLQVSVDYMTQYKEDFLNASTVVGASGSVFGLLLAFGMLFPNSIIYLYFAIPIKAKYFVILYGAFELFSGIIPQQGDNVAHFAHLGGMLFGFFLIRYWNKHDRANFY